MSKNLWTREELILALYWYCTKISFSKIKYTKPEVIELSNLVSRTPSAVAFKLVNLARLDPALQKRGVKGMSRGSKNEEPVWNEFYGNWDDLAYTAEKIIAEKKKLALEKVSNIETADLPKEGREREALVKIRINHKFFSDTVKISYQNKCCITGLSVKSLLVASHIKPWSKDLKQAANPENGLCLNALHDKAFDKGFLTLSEDLRIVLSQELLKKRKDEFIQKYFIPFQNKEITKPVRFMPNQEFLQYHRDTVFIQ
ncbi:MAG TPA: restriction endonuclease [Chryseobacterium sp.]|nr:restriction endonuclease [Chryseobacterium sp.]